MEEERTIISTLSDLIQRASPLTAASSLVPTRPISASETHRSSHQNHCQKPFLHKCQNPDSQTLKPLNHPTLLIGTVTLPCFANRNSPIKCHCFQFSDDSANICCDILDFDPKMIDLKIRILAWNFIPLKCGNRDDKGGFLEIISWEFFQACTGNFCSLSDFGCFCLSLGACDVRDKWKVSCLIFGVIESISPASVNLSANGESGSRNISGFLVNILVCQCKCCSSECLVSELRVLSEKNVKDHCFDKTVFVYFYGLTSSWHPVISRIIGDVVLLTGLKKKLVLVSKEESQLIYVTTDEVSLHMAKLFKERRPNQNTDIKGKGECGSYTGVITGSYMQGMVLELDQDVMLVLTDQHLKVPHSVRIGALLTLKNVHFVDPKFPWGKMLILGACFRTSMHVQSFSPFQSWCHLKSRSPSLLQKFIDSLSFATRLWALLVVSCLRRKFVGILSEKEILGSKHKEGLAQKYASSHLPLSGFQLRHGVLLEFCKHDLCSGGKEASNGHLRLVLPIANLISYCEVSWKKVLADPENYSDFVGGSSQEKPFLCRGKSYEQSIRRVLHSEEIGVLLLGNLKISLSSGRLQLVDATGVIDIMLDLPATWGFERIFQAKDFRLIMEGVSPKLVDLDSTIYQPLSCRSMFSNAVPLRSLKTAIYLYCCPSDEDSRSCSLLFDWKGNSQEFDSGKYHLLMVTHKFPAQQKFLGDLAKRSNMFAEAIVLPWDLFVAGNCKNAVTTMVSSGNWKDSLQNFTRPKMPFTHKICKIELASAEVSNCSPRDAGNASTSHCTGSCNSHSNIENTSHVSNNGPEVPCLPSGKGVNFNWIGMLRCLSEHAEIISGYNPPRRKVLLEFGPDSFCKYEALKIGHSYLVKHQEGQTLCHTTKYNQISHAKLFISSKTHIRGFTFSSIECLQSDDVSDGFPLSNFHTPGDDLMSKGPWEFEIPCLIGNSVHSKIYSDFNIFVPSSALKLLKNIMNILDCNPDELRDSFEEESGIHDLGGSTINASMQSSGTSCSDYCLPEGNLITLRGLVLAFHDCHGVTFPAQPRHVPAESSMLTFLQETAVCVHVFVDKHIVRIFCDQSRQTYPVGFGRDAYATFHRILVVSEPNKYMMTPVSFITIDNTNLMSCHLARELNHASGTIGLPSVASPNTASTAMLCDALQLSELGQMQFRCRVVSLYILVVEKAGPTAISQSCVQSRGSAFGIPFAGFIMDDGSSSCCCWLDSERAATFLDLLSKVYLLEDSLETYGRCKAGNVGRLNKILEQHGRVIAKNYGSIFDSSCQDIAFYVNSERSLSSSDEDVLRSLLANAFLSTSWTVVGTKMDSKASGWLERRLSEVDVAFPPLLNIWATSVCKADMLTEARSIIEGLV